MRSISIKAAIVVMAACVLASCEDDAQRPPKADMSIGAAPARFTVEAVQEFRDDAAYHYKRRIYLITDTKTGREYFGVSGVGITDVGVHRVTNTTTAQDER